MHAPLTTDFVFTPDWLKIKKTYILSYRSFRDLFELITKFSIWKNAENVEFISLEDSSFCLVFQQLRHNQQQISVLQNEVDTLRSDNVKLYEKIKFLQSYPTKVTIYQLLGNLFKC